MENRIEPTFLEITLKNILSFGPDPSRIGLDRLNLLIGPNASGKSNLIEAVGLLRSTPGGVRDVVRKGGGVSEWIWKGRQEGSASIGVVVRNPFGSQPIRHVIEFGRQAQAFHLEDERIENEAPYGSNTEPYFYYRYQKGRPVLNVRTGERQLIAESVEPDQSILAQRRDPESYPEVSYLAETYESVRIYREWSFGRSAVFRQPQQADARNDVLEEDFSNLGLFLNRLKLHVPAKRKILASLKELYPDISDFDVRVEGGSVLLYFTEGEYSIPATRLSDGTLRYLALLAILCDPKPPPLICIEEPELGLHPDVLPKVADLLVEASEKTQLIVTTHSDILVDTMTEHPEVVLTCERHDGISRIQRLDAGELEKWLDEYRLGELWTSGRIGATRW